MNGTLRKAYDYYVEKWTKEGEDVLQEHLSGDESYVTDENGEKINNYRNVLAVEDPEDFVTVLLNSKGTYSNTGNYPEYHIVNNIDMSKTKTKKYQYGFDDPTFDSGDTSSRIEIFGHGYELRNLVVKNTTQNPFLRTTVEDLKIINYVLVNVSSFRPYDTIFKNCQISLYCINSSLEYIFLLKYESCTLNIGGTSSSIFSFPASVEKTHIHFDDLLIKSFQSSNILVGHGSGSIKESCITGNIVTTSAISAVLLQFRSTSNNTYQLNNSYFAFSITKVDGTPVQIVAIEVGGANYECCSLQGVSFIDKDKSNCTEGSAGVPSDFYLLTTEQATDPDYLLKIIGFPVLKIGD